MGSGSPFELKAQLLSRDSLRVWRASPEREERTPYVQVGRPLLQRVPKRADLTQLLWLSVMMASIAFSLSKVAAIAGVRDWVG